MRHALHRRPRGFTLVDLLATLSVAGVLSGIAYPSFVGSIEKGRRADALIALARVQIAQERWRFNHASYGALDQIGLGADSAGEHYRLEMVSADGDGFEVRTVARGPQAHDRNCRVLSLRIDGAVDSRRSGPDETTSNPPELNRRCWSR